MSPAGIGEDFSTAPPVSLYGSTKVASEQLALEYAATFGFPTYILRCGVLAGAGQFGQAEQGIFSYWIHSYRRRARLRYIGFGGQGHQLRDALHPRDLAPLLRRQIAAGARGDQRVINVAGGVENSMSLAELSAWCEARFGAHAIESDPAPRPFDLPWIVLDSARAREVWGWEPQTRLPQLLEEIAEHADREPGWLDLAKG
jgi:CDP-paratose 2-epimerase